MKTIKCESCGANIQINNENITCPYCGTTIVNDNQPATKTETSTTTIINNYYSTNESNYSKPFSSRPKLNLILLLFLFCISFWPGLIYFFYVKYKQNKWDKQNRK